MSNRLAIDANLLVLLTVGQVERSWIARHKRLGDYSVRDFDFLARIVSGFQVKVLTPNAATEADNLIVFGVSDPLRARFRVALAHILSSFDEQFMATAEVGRHPDYPSLGLTDAVWLGVLDSGSVLLTADRDLHLTALRRGATAYFFKDVKHVAELH